MTPRKCYRIIELIQRFYLFKIEDIEAEDYEKIEKFPILVLKIEGGF